MSRPAVTARAVAARVAVAALVLLLAACAAQPVRTALPPAARAAAEARQLEREATLGARDDWSFSGRIAVSNGRDGGSGRIDWQQQGGGYEIALSAPVTRQSWRLRVDAGGAALEGLEGGTRRGVEPSILLREATGWDIPVDALQWWVRGLRAPEVGGASIGVAIEYGADGRPAAIEQGGWRIDYAWPASPSAVLPERLDARRNGARVKLVIDAWGDAPSF